MVVKKSGGLAAPHDQLPTIIDVDSLARRFGKVNAVDGVSFTVGENEIFALLGPNGSGKSTLLRMLCGYLQPSSGEISILGSSLREHPRIAKSVLGYVPDEGGLYLHMHVRRFLNFMAGVKNVPQNDREYCIERVVEKLQLEAVINKRISSLSRGYRQRVSIAQALINQPSVVLMDEPTNGLDPSQIRQWRELMITLKEQCTIIFTSHILDEVSALADRVGLLIEGKLCALETLRGDVARLTITLDAADVGVLRSAPHLNLERVGGAAGGLIKATMKLDGQAIPDVITALASQGVRIHAVERVNVDLEGLFFGALDANAQDKNTRGSNARIQ